jgi:hypothetical protein
LKQEKESLEIQIADLQQQHNKLEGLKQLVERLQDKLSMSQATFAQSHGDQIVDAVNLSSFSGLHKEGAEGHQNYNWAKVVFAAFFIH